MIFMFHVLCQLLGDQIKEDEIDGGHIKYDRYEKYIHNA